MILNFKKNTFISQKNLNYYNLNFKNKIKISQKLGLNCKKHFIVLKKKHINTINNHKKEKKNEIKFFAKTIEFLKIIKNNKSIRNFSGYPSRGQRTHTNGKTKKKLKFTTKINKIQK